MKIALVCTEKLPSPAIKGGAIQLMIDGIVPYLMKKYKITIYSILDEKLLAQANQNGIEYVRFPFENYYEQVTDHIQNRSFDLIHLFNRPKMVERMYQASPNSAIVVSLHNDMFSPLKLPPHDAKKAIERTHGIATVSEYIKRTITKRYPEATEKTFVAYSGIDLAQFPLRTSPNGEKMRNEMRKTLGIDEKKVILFVGRLSKTKGPHLLIQAMQKVKIDHPDAVLLIVGGKWFSDDGVNRYVRSLYKLAEPLKDHVLFTNYVPAEEIPSLLLAGDLFVCSSQWHEPLARIHYEAMAATLPIITTHRGGNSEVIFNGFNGVVIHHYNRQESFYKVISYLLNNPERCETLAKNGRQLVEMNFQYKHTASRYDKIYEYALYQKARRH